MRLPFTLKCTQGRTCPQPPPHYSALHLEVHPGAVATTEEAPQGRHPTYLYTLVVHHSYCLGPPQHPSMLRRGAPDIEGPQGWAALHIAGGSVQKGTLHRSLGSLGTPVPEEQQLMPQQQTRMDPNAWGGTMRAP